MILTPDNCHTYDAATGKTLIRLHSEGYGVLIDDNHETRMAEHRCAITTDEEIPDVGTMGGAMRHLTYTNKDGQQMHCYTVITSNIDTYQEEWINSKHPMDGRTAADLIEQARILAYPRMYSAERYTEALSAAERISKEAT